MGLLQVECCKLGAVIVWTAFCRRGAVSRLWLYMGIVAAGLPPVSVGQAQVLPAGIPTNKLLSPTPRDQRPDNTERPDRLQDNASRPGEREEPRPFGRDQGAPLETFKDAPLR